MWLKELSIDEVKSVYYDDMKRDFPESELKPYAVVEKLCLEGTCEAVGIFMQDQMVAYALLVLHSGGNSVLLDYLAVRPEFRGTGVGTEILHTFIEYYKGKKDAIIFECEHPDYAPNKKQAVRRIDFYKAAGAKISNIQVVLFGVRFVLLAFECTPDCKIDIAHEIQGHYHVTVPKERYEDAVYIFEEDIIY